MRRFIPLLVVLGLVSGGVLIAPVAAAVTPPTVRVAGNQLVGPDGAPLTLAGVNKAGTEYACSQGWGLHDGPVDSTGIALMSTWKVNAVRVPLNESCWLGAAGVPREFAGGTYRAFIRSFVDRLHAAGMIAVLDLHLTAATGVANYPQAPMPNAANSVRFWESVAAEYRSVPGVVFELFNEPRDTSWSCWRDGCDMPGGWRAAGMQQLIDAIRATGATQPIVVEGLGWGNDLSGWFSHPLRDPAGQLVAGFHVYQHSQCATQACWDATVAAVAATVPVITTEFGQDDCGTAFTKGFMSWADVNGISYLAWTWNDWAGCGGPVLLLDYAGTPSAMGAVVRDHFLSRSDPVAPPPGDDPVQPSDGSTAPPPADTVLPDDPLPPSGDDPVDELPPADEVAPPPPSDPAPPTRGGKGKTSKPTRVKMETVGATSRAAATCTPRLRGRVRLTRLEDRKTVARIVIHDTKPGSRWRVVVRRAGESHAVASVKATRAGTIRVQRTIRAPHDDRIRVVARGPRDAVCRRTLRLPSEPTAG